MVSHAGVMAYGWFDASEVASNNREGSYRFQGIWSSVKTKPLAELVERGTLPMADEMKDNLIGAGVAEHVLIQKLNGVASTYTDSELCSEPLVAIKYELTNDSRDSSAPDTVRQKRIDFRRSTEDQKLLVVMLFPESISTKLIEKAVNNPAVYREILEAAVTEKLGFTETWTGDGSGRNQRPPYEKWKELNGGVSKIAITDKIHGNPTEVVEF